MTPETREKAKAVECDCWPLWSCKKCPGCILREALAALEAAENKVAGGIKVCAALDERLDYAQKDATLSRVSIAVLQKRLADAEKDAEDSKQDVLKMLNLFCRFLQPGGSPPGLQGVAFAEWVARTVRERFDSLMKYTVHKDKCERRYGRGCSCGYDAVTVGLR